MADFKPGDQVYTLSYRTGSYENWNGPYTVLGRYRRSGHEYHYTYREDPKGNVYKVLRSEAGERNCWTCNGEGRRNADNPAMPQIKCKTCEGTGKIEVPVSFDYVTNRSDKIISVFEYNEKQARLKGYEDLKKKTAEEKKQRIAGHIAKIVRLAKEAEDPEKAVAEYLGKYSYADYSYKSNHIQYVTQSEIYNAAYQWKEAHKETKV